MSEFLHHVTLTDADLTLLADALDIIDPDSEEEAERAEAIAIWFRSKIKS